MGKSTKKRADVEKIVEYFETLVKIPSPTGFTNGVIKYLESNAKEKGIDYEITRKGAMIYKFEADKPSKNIMVAVHVDTLGAIIKGFKDDRIIFDMIGGYPLEYVIGNYVTIHTYDGKSYEGTILPNDPAAHVNKALKDKKFDMDFVSIRPDIRLKSDKDKLQNYCEVGNFVSFDPNFSRVNGYVKSRFLDNKVSAAIILYISDVLAGVEKKKPKLKNNVYFFFNVTEETGQGIAGYPDIDDILVIDMAALGEGLTGDEYTVSLCVKDSTGPYNYDFTREIAKLCDKNRIKYNLDIYPFYGSDGSGALRAGADSRVALIGPGVGASHGYERTHEDALKGVSDLVLKYLTS
jgi:putative aminopeptidase FrvX